jgi:hypothetical protein
LGEKLGKGKLYIDGIEFGEIAEIEFNPEPMERDEGRFNFSHSCSGTITLDKEAAKQFRKALRKSIWKYRFEKLISNIKGFFK